MTWRPKFSWKALIVFTVVMGASIGMAVRWHLKRKAADAIYMAAARGNVKEVRYYLELDPSLALGVNGLLGAAASAGNKDIVLLLLEHGAAVDDRRETSGRTALMQVLYSDASRADVVELLLKQGADANARDASGVTVLMYAAMAGSKVEIVEMILAHGAEVNAAETGGRRVTALHLAALLRMKPSGVLRLLLRAGADIDARDASGLTALDWAVKKGNVEKAALLRKFKDSTIPGPPAPNDVEEPTEGEPTE